MKRILFILVMLLTIQTQAQIINDNLIARNTGQYPMWTGDTVRVMGFAKTLSAAVNIPGPTLIYNEGDSIRLDLWNVSQGAPHTIHLHGLDVDQQNDGVPHLSFEVEHMQHGYYNFKAPHAGTYLYHCHVVSTIHVQAGMYGLLIVKPPNGSNTTWSGGYPYDEEQAWMTSEVDSVWHRDSIIIHPYDTSVMMHHVTIPKYEPQFFLVNGLSENQLDDASTAINTSANATFYLRLANIGFCGNKFTFPSNLNALIVSSDGRPLPTAEQSDTLWVFPGERYGVLLNPASVFEDSIKVEYSNLNTGTAKNTQYVPVHVQGYFGITEIESSAFSIFPNPSSGKFIVQKNGLHVQPLFVFDVFGKKVAGFQIQEHETELNLNMLPSGIYFIRLGTYQKKLILFR